MTANSISSRRTPTSDTPGLRAGGIATTRSLIKQRTPVNPEPKLYYKAGQLSAGYTRVPHDGQTLNRGKRTSAESAAHHQHVLRPESFSPPFPALLLVLFSSPSPLRRFSQFWEGEPRHVSTSHSDSQPNFCHEESEVNRGSSFHPIH